MQVISAVAEFERICFLSVRTLVLRERKLPESGLAVLQH